jgi:hypothetical protein
MKSYYRLINYQLMSILKPLMLIYIGTIISPLVLLNAAMQNYNNMHSRFSVMMEITSYDQDRFKRVFG